jgi:hypothetical protein
VAQSLVTTSAVLVEGRQIGALGGAAGRVGELPLDAGAADREAEALAADAADDQALSVVAWAGAGGELAPAVRGSAGRIVASGLDR